MKHIQHKSCHKVPAETEQVQPEKIFSLAGGGLGGGGGVGNSCRTPMAEPHTTFTMSHNSKIRAQEPLHKPESLSNWNTAPYLRSTAAEPTVGERHQQHPWTIPTSQAHAPTRTLLQDTSASKRSKRSCSRF